MADLAIRGKCGTGDSCDGTCIDRKCVLCGGNDHVSSERSKCPKWAHENDILKVMTLKRMSRKEVLKSYAVGSYETFDKYEENFPALGGGKPRSGDRGTLNREIQ